MPRLSCIIPVNDSVHALEATLISVLANRPEDCEILVALSTPYADPYDVKDEVRLVEATPRAGYIDCANLGIQASRGAVVHVLAAGLEVTEGWADAALARFADPSVAAVAPVIRSGNESGKIVAAGLAYGRGGRRIVCRDPAAEGRATAPLGPLAEAAFYRKSTLALLGGLPAPLGDELADVDLALALRLAGFRAELEARSTIVRPHLKGSTIRAKRAQGFQYGLAAERLFWRNRSRTGRWSALALHACTMAGQMLRDPWPPAILGQLAGRLTALKEFTDFEKRQQQLRELHDALPAQALPRTMVSPRSGERRVDAAHSPLRAAASQDVRVGRP